MRALLFSLLLLFSCKDRTEAPNNRVSAADTSVIAPPDSLLLLFTGDIMQHLPQITAAYDSEKQDYDYTECFRYVRKHWQQADWVIGNLETTLCDRNFSGYPLFASPWQLARDLKRAGMDVLVTANNHSCDRGASGIRQTLHYLDSLGIWHTGTFSDSTDCRPLILDKNGFRLALLNYTYGTNGIPVPKGTVVALPDTVRMQRDIDRAKADSADHIIAFVHWGDEYSHLPGKQQKEWGDWLESRGADIVVGSHPHVVQTMQYRTQGQDTTGVRIYSLGNFVSNQSKPYTNGGVSAALLLVRRPDRSVSYRLQYINHIVCRPFRNGKRIYTIVPECDRGVIDNEREKTLLQHFVRHTRHIIDSTVEKNNDWNIR